MKCKRCGKNLIGNRTVWCSDFCSKYGLKAEYNKRFMAKNHDKWLARKRVEKALYYGKIFRPNHCEHCGAITVIQAHHADYSKPLDVIWVCESCHQKIHSTDGGSVPRDVLSDK